MDQLSNKPKDFEKFLELEQLKMDYEKTVAERAQLLDKVQHLETLLLSRSQIIDKTEKAELIALEQLEILKVFSSERTLTPDETKQLDTYNKIINGFNDKRKNPQDHKEISEDALINILNG